MKHHVSLLSVALCVSYCGPMCGQAPAGKSALLIGINTYQHPPGDIKVPDGAPPEGRYQPALTYPNLKGPENDVASMKELLTSAKFGFPNDDKHIHVLLEKDATRDGILKAMQQYLVKDPNPGDTVLLYVSSHGSVRVDPKGHGQLFDLDGSGRHPTYLENTIVPYDWYLGVDDIFSRDLRHIFNQAADRGIHVTAIFDSCHSGSLSRGAKNSALVPRDFDYDPRPMPPDPFPAETAASAPENRTDNPVLVLSAAQKDQSAVDVQNATPPHGLFTAALIETLQTLPASRSVEDIFRRLQIAMELSPAAINQQPQLDASVSRRKQPLFGGAAGAGPATATIVSTGSTGVVLDVGLAGDIGPGSEFTELTGADGARAVLRITESIGLARSKAAVVSPDGAQVQPKDVLELTKWVPAERPTLNFYPGPSSPAASAIQEALNVIAASGVKLTADPSLEPWTHRVFWDGARWVLRAHSTKTSAGQVQPGKTVTLGAKISPGELKKLGAASSVWLDAPLPRESLQGLLPPISDGSRPRAAVLTSDRNQATYVIAGTAAASTIRYTWFKRSDLDSEVQTPREIGPGCSPNSSFPMRTDWVAAAQPESLLTASAMRLAQLNGWLQIGSSLSGQSDFPYQLVLHSVQGNEDVADGGATHKADYELDLLAAVHSSITPRFVYVLEIDCQGKGALLWPAEGQPAARFPGDKERLDRIPLPGSAFGVGAPFGTDTYLLLTTSSPLADPWALEFKGVVKRGGNSAPPQSLNPLEDLLDSASSGSRSASRPTPTNWSVQTVRTESRGN